MKRLVPRLFCSLALLISSVLAHPVPDNPQWLTYPGGDGPGKGKHIVLIAAEQEYRSEQSMPMMAKILSNHHGFDCTVLFAVNDKGEVDPTMPVYPEKGNNGKNAMAAVMYGISAIHPKETKYYAKMVTASFQNREYGHTGQGFSYLWGARDAERHARRETET